MSEDFDFLSMIAPENREAVTASFRKHVQGEDVEPYEYALVTRDGRRIETVLSSKLINYEGERAILGTVIDITERKRVEEALQESERKYRTLFEAESDAIFLIENESGRILEANSAASALYGYSREELLTKRNVDLSAEPEDTRQVTQETPVVVEQVVTIPLRFHRKKDGTVFPVEITGRFFNWQGRPVHIAAIRDISERMQAEEALRESEARYRSLFEHSPISLWEQDFSEVKRYVDSLRTEGTSDLGAYFEDHPDAVAHCVGLIKIVDVNQATLNLFRADGKHSLSNLEDIIVPEETLNIFREALLVLIEGQTHCATENLQLTLTGEKLHLR